jgi:uncharacterized membrane-anchored protein
MMKKYRIHLLVLVVVLQTAALAGMVALKHRTLITGTPILLKTEPIDPRSLFRGDYVRLNYKIGRIHRTELGDGGLGVDDFSRHDPIYVKLRKGEKFWETVSVHRDMPAHGQDTVVIRGEVQWVGGDAINVRYGIENFFVPEGEGRALERPGEVEVVTILVAVDSRGNSAIKAILVNDELRYEEKLF